MSVLPKKQILFKFSFVQTLVITPHRSSTKPSRRRLKPMLTPSHLSECWCSHTREQSGWIESISSPAVAPLGTRHETAVDANRGGKWRLWEPGQPCSAEHAVPSPLQQSCNQYWELVLAQGPGAAQGLLGILTQGKEELLSLVLMISQHTNIKISAAGLMPGIIRFSRDCVAPVCLLIPG